MVGCPGDVEPKCVSVPNRRIRSETFSSMRVAVALLPGLVEPTSTRLFALRPVAGSNKPGELAEGSTPMILAAAESIRFAGILFPGKGVLVPGRSITTGDAEKSPLRNAALGTDEMLAKGADCRSPS